VGGKKKEKKKRKKEKKKKRKKKRKRKSTHAILTPYLLPRLVGQSAENMYVEREKYKKIEMHTRHYTPPPPNLQKQIEVEGGNRRK